MNLLELVEQYRRQAQDVGSGGPTGSAAAVVSLINTVYVRLCERAVRADAGWFRERSDIPFVQGRERYPLPFRARTVKRLQAIRAAGTSAEIEVGDLLPVQELEAQIVARNIFPHIRFFLDGPYIRLVGAFASTTNIGTLRVWYEGVPARLSSGIVTTYTTFTEDDPAGTTVTRGRIVLPEIPSLGSTFVRADYYRNSLLQIVEGPGADDIQIVRLHSGPTTRTIDLDSTLLGVATPADVNGKSVYSFLPRLPEAFHDLIYLEAVHDALASEANNRALTALAPIRTPRLQEFREALAARESVIGEGVKQVSEPSGGDMVWP